MRLKWRRIPSSQAITLFVRGTKGNEYTILISWKNQDLLVHCNCPAGMHGWFCKHRFAILSGDESILAKPMLEGTRRKLKEWLSKTEYSSLVSEMKLANTTFMEAEKALETPGAQFDYARYARAWRHYAEAEEHLKGLKRLIANVMRQGI